MKVADRIALWLAEKGITHGFGIIGGGNVALWDAIARLGRTHLVACHHEQAATMASTAFARCTGRIGFALVTTGAGSANAITGVMAAHMDGIPLLVISGNEATKYMNAPTRIWGVQGYDSSLVATHFTKTSLRMRRDINLNEVAWRLDLLHGIAMQAPQGPVWIDMPKDTQNEMVA